MFKYLARKRKINQTVRELSGMTDKELNDIGISRYDIMNVARQSFKR